jgi:hypothetical protein
MQFSAFGWTGRTQAGETAHPSPRLITINVKAFISIMIAKLATASQKR